ncbi:hypothetical protein EXIGLDRAFT_76923 [Exidia glandulosa HHB12029]|uniref:Uncharacterized protein n=1 Tax=Exidia glandulosa HHB12029 TaxID=1314781 RepID=A0A165NWJ1_EXIGL|nr:hypothetical protein EXIGLDRAFT_76923 [Exidia glandulosa HHB12029]
MWPTLLRATMPSALLLTPGNCCVVAFFVVALVGTIRNQLACQIVGLIGGTFIGILDRNRTPEPRDRTWVARMEQCQRLVIMMRGARAATTSVLPLTVVPGPYSDLMRPIASLYRDDPGPIYGSQATSAANVIDAELSETALPTTAPYKDEPSEKPQLDDLPSIPAAGPRPGLTIQLPSRGSAFDDENYVIWNPGSAYSQSLHQRKLQEYWRGRLRATSEDSEGTSGKPLLSF